MKSNKKIIILIAIVFTICISAIAVTSLTGNSGQNTIQAALATGEKYLDQLEYDKAIATYESIIKIDYKCIDAYIGISQAYEAKGEVLKAAQTITLAYPMVESEDRATLEDRLKELAELYEEIKSAIENGTLVLSPDIDKDAFDIFFHILINNTKENENASENDENTFYRMDADFPVEHFQYTVFGKLFEEWDYDSFREYVTTTLELRDTSDNYAYYYDPVSWDEVSLDLDNSRLGFASIYTDDIWYDLSDHEDRRYHMISFQSLSPIGNNTIVTIKGYLDSIYPGFYDTLYEHEIVQFNNCYVRIYLLPERVDSNNVEDQYILFYFKDKIIHLRLNTNYATEDGSLFYFDTIEIEIPNELPYYIDWLGGTYE